MSRVFYEFATPSGTSWCHSVTCDLCRVKVEREGPLPKRETGDPTPAFKAEALVGWASWSMRGPRPADPMLAALDESLWPRFDRDFCPSCAQKVEDLFQDVGAQISEQETRFLDALGRKVGGRDSMQGIRCCLAERSLSGLPGRCLRPVGHEGEHGMFDAPGFFLCAVCSAYVAGELYMYTQAQLEWHAVSQHNILFEDQLGGLRAAGWISTLETPRVAYANVQSALQAEWSVLHRSLRR